jgi:transposase
MNVLKPDKKATIITLLTHGISQHEISRKAGIDRKTIRRYGRLHNLLTTFPSAAESKSPSGQGVATGAADSTGQNPPSRPPAFEGRDQETIMIPAHARSACEEHRQWIEQQVQLGRNAVAMYQDLVEQFGFTSRYNSVKRFVRALRKKQPQQYDRLEFLPGEEAQVDYGQGALTRHPGTGTYRRPRLFVMTLRYSRRSFRKVVWKSSQEVWAQLHEEAFRYFGGCPQYVVLDNLKEGVIKPDLYEPELNPVYAALLAHYGVVADPARVGDPNRKGTVENAIQHTQNTALKGRRFESIEEQNRFLLHWEETWAAQRIHGRTKRQVAEMFVEEKPSLKILPHEKFAFFRQEVRTVYDDGTIQVQDSYYAALPAPLHSKVMVRIYEQEIEIINPKTMTIIRRHPKSRRRGSVLMDEKDRIFNPSRQTCYLFARAAEIGPHTNALCKLLFEEQGRPGQRRMQGIVSMVRRHKAIHIEQAASLAIEKGLRTVRIIRRIVTDLAGTTKKTEPQKAIAGLTQDHQLIRPPHDYGAFFEHHAAGSAGGEVEVVTKPAVLQSPQRSPDRQSEGVPECIPAP